MFNLLILAMLVAPFFSALTNSDPVFPGGGRIIPGIRLYDALSMVSGALVTLIPFLLARRHLATPEAHVTLLRALALMGVVYSLLILIEVRISPQLSNWIYGFFPHSFAQHIRNGGFRPIVFLPHGLWVGIFMAMTVLSALTLARLAPDGKARTRWILVGAWLFLVLILSKTLGALAIATLLAPVAMIAGMRGQHLMAAALGGVLLFYPMLRGAGWIPVERISAWATSIDAERGGSLDFRLKNEDVLLDRANLKPLFGWGGWGRSAIFDPMTGESTSITDGAWIIVVGLGGWVGYLAQFGLLTLPVIVLAFRRRREDLAIATAGLSLVLAANLVDLIPNGTIVTLTWMIAGALAGRCEIMRPAPADGSRGSPVRIQGKASPPRMNGRLPRHSSPLPNPPGSA